METPWPKNTIQEILNSLVKKWVTLSITYGDVYVTIQGELNYTQATDKYMVNGTDTYVGFKASDVRENNDFDGNSIFLKNPKLDY